MPTKTPSTRSATSRSSAGSPPMAERQAGSIPGMHPVGAVRTVGTMHITSKEKPHVEESAAEKRARKARIVDRRKARGA